MFSRIIKPFKIMVSLILVLLMVFIVGCSKDSGDGTEHSNSKKSSDKASSGTLSNTSSENVSSKEDINKEKSEPQYTYTTTFSSTVENKRLPSDANEVLAKGNTAELSSHLTGYADKKAEELRNNILNSENTDKLYEITGTKYYISPAGDDFLNDGKSPEKPWRTLDALDNVKLNAGDAVLFKRNSVFRLNRSLNVRSGVIYGSYGTGTKPNIYASPKNYAAEGMWEPSNKKNVWKAEFAYEQAGGMVFNHGEQIGYFKHIGLDDLTGNLQYYHNVKDGMIYLYWDKGNPSKSFNDIEIMPGYFIIHFPSRTSDIVIDNLCLKYSSYHGIRLDGENNNITIKNCEIGYIGGLALPSGLRFGNAIEFWENCENVTVENNWIYQTFDSAITWQGTNGVVNSNYKNISFSGNLLEYNNADIEFFDTAGAKAENFRIENNIMRFTSLGWGTRLDDAGIRGIQGCIRGGTNDMDLVKNVLIKNNIFDTPGLQIINWKMNRNKHYNFEISGNSVFVKNSYRIKFGSYQEKLFMYGIGLVESENDGRANNQSELEKAFSYFDNSKTAIVKWYD